MNLVLQKCVGNNLKLLRNYHGLSQQRMAESVDITRSLYVQYELGNARRTPRCCSISPNALRSRWSCCSSRNRIPSSTV